MKRIVNGVTYNTATATRLARSRLATDSEAETLVQTLYKTRGGAFFVVERRTVTEWDEADRDMDTRKEFSVHPLTSEEALAWMMKGNVKTFRKNPFGDPPEAVADLEPAATIYVRVPATLKRDVDAAADKSKLSSNAWVMRCLENSLDGRSLLDYKELGYIYEIASTFDSHREDGQWSRKQCLEALSLIAGYALKLSTKLSMQKELEEILSTLGGDIDYHELRKRFDPYQPASVTE